jgi:CheY-like chemotaxis protein
VKLQGGSIAAASPGKGEGATFTISLPLLAGKKMTTSRPQILAVAETPSLLGGILVLVVDDEADARAATRVVLEEAGAETIVVGSTDEALDILRQRQPDVILSDIGMPGRDGYDLLRSVRALTPRKGGRIPAIAFTAYAASEDRARALGAGFQMHLAKPVDRGTLIAAIAALVSRTGLGPAEKPRRSRKSGR